MKKLFLIFLFISLITCLCLSFVSAVPIVDTYNVMSQSVANVIRASTTSSGYSFLKTEMTPLSWTYGPNSYESWGATFEAMSGLTPTDFTQHQISSTMQDLFPMFEHWNSSKLIGYTSATFNIVLRYYKKSGVTESFYPDSISAPVIKIGQGNSATTITPFDDYYVVSDDYITYVYSFSVYFSAPELISASDTFSLSVSNPPSGDSPDFLSNKFSISIMDTSSMSFAWNYQDFDFRDPYDEEISDRLDDLDIPSIRYEIEEQSVADIFSYVAQFDLVVDLIVPMAVTAITMFIAKCAFFGG